MTTTMWITATAISTEEGPSHTLGGVPARVEGGLVVGVGGAAL